MHVQILLACQRKRLTSDDRSNNHTIQEQRKKFIGFWNIFFCPVVTFISGNSIASVLSIKCVSFVSGANAKYSF